ncbi:MAG: hypothetical protein U1G05_19260 [Kiritimatiellia bacterium]
MFIFGKKARADRLRKKWNNPAMEAAAAGNFLSGKQEGRKIWREIEVLYPCLEDRPPVAGIRRSRKLHGWSKPEAE